MLKNYLKMKIMTWLPVAALLVIQTIPAQAILPEPETLIYGQVFNQYQNNKIMVTDAQIKWNIRKKGSDTIQDYQGAVECMQCQEYDTEGLNCMSCEKIMTLNHVQERLINELVIYAQKKYPEIQLKKIVESPGDSNHIWGIVSGIDWDNDDKVMDFTEYVSYKQDDFLVEYGYPIALMPVPVDAFP